MLFSFFAFFLWSGIHPLKVSLEPQTVELSTHSEILNKIEDKQQIKVKRQLFQSPLTSHLMPSTSVNQVYSGIVNQQKVTANIDLGLKHPTLNLDSLKAINSIYCKNDSIVVAFNDAYTAQKVAILPLNSNNLGRQKLDRSS